MPNETKHPLAAWREAQTPPVSQGDFAKGVHVGRWTINSIETGRRKPSPKLARELERHTGIPKAALRPDLWGAA